MTQITPTHVLELADGFGTTPCELVVEGRFLSTVRIYCHCYWENPRTELRAVRTANLRATSPEVAS